MEKNLKTGRKPGTPKTGGRAKGTPNKVTKEVRDVIKGITTDYFNNGSFDIDFKKLEPKDRVLVVEKLLKYHIPTLSSIDAKVYSNQEIEEKVRTMTDEQFFELIDKVKEFND